MTAIEDLMAAMQARAPALRQLGYRVRFDVTDLGRSILLDGTGGMAAVTEADEDAEADSALRLSSDDLAGLVAGRLSPMLAFATGRLKLEGSKGVAMKLASLLDED